MDVIEDDCEPGAGAHPAKSDADTADQVSQEAQKKGTVLKESMRGSENEIRNSNARAHRATPSPSAEKLSGAGPAISEHSKDAQAPKGGRQPGAYVKE